MAPSELTPYDARTVGDRYDARIGPDASHWIAVRDQFQELLDDQDSTLDSILTRYFSPRPRASHARDFTTVSRRHAAGQHEAVPSTYQPPLRLERPGIALKLALAYFGHPVEPVHVELFRVIDEDIAMVDCSMKGREEYYNYMPVPLEPISALGIPQAMSPTSPELQVLPPAYVVSSTASSSSGIINSDTQPSNRSPPTLSCQSSRQDMETPVYSSMPLRGTSDSFYQALDTHLKADHTITDHSDCCAWFVHLTGESAPNDILPEPNRYERASDLVVLTAAEETCPNAPRQPVAYFPLRSDVGPVISSACGHSVYSTYMMTAIRLLQGGYLGPGDNHSLVAIYDDKNMHKDRVVRAYGGLLNSDKVFKSLHLGQQTIVGAARNDWHVDIQQLPDDEIVFCLPGYGLGPRRTYETHSVRDPDPIPAAWLNSYSRRYRAAFEAVHRLLTTHLTPQGLRSTKSITFYKGWAVWNTRVGYHLNTREAFDVQIQPCDEDDDGNLVEPPWAATLADHLFDVIERGYHGVERLLVLQPQYATYKIFGKWSLSVSGSAGRMMYPDNTDNNGVPYTEIAVNGLLGEFREAVKVLVEQKKDSKGNPKTPADWKNVWIEALSVPFDGGFVTKGDLARVPRPVRQKPQTELGSTLEGRPGPRISPIPGTREVAWAKQPSVFDGSPQPRIPTTATPLERLIRVGGPGVPRVSTAVMTPTEQYKLQETLAQVRNSQLQRITKCHYANCEFTCRIDHEHVMQKHLRDDHSTRRCPWCPLIFPSHWKLKRIEEHMVKRHMVGNRPSRAQPSGIVEMDLRRGASVQLPGSEVVKNQRASSVSRGGRGRPMTREERRAEARDLDAHWPQPVMAQQRRDPEPAEVELGEIYYLFCDRCGRNHRALSNVADRERHDQVCCGKRVWENAAAAAKYEPNSRYPHTCAGGTSTKWCKKCGLDRTLLNPTEVVVHDNECKGIGHRVGDFCAFCQATLKGIADWDVREKHMDECARAAYADPNGTADDDPGFIPTPYTTYPATYYDNPRQTVDPARDRFYAGWGTGRGYVPPGRTKSAWEMAIGKRRPRRGDEDYVEGAGNAAVRKFLDEVQKERESRPGSVSPGRGVPAPAQLGPQEVPDAVGLFYDGEQSDFDGERPRALAHAAHGDPSDPQPYNQPCPECSQVGFANQGALITHLEEDHGIDPEHTVTRPDGSCNKTERFKTDDLREHLIKDHDTPVADIHTSGQGIITISPPPQPNFKDTKALVDHLIKAHGQDPTWLRTDEAGNVHIVTRHIRDSRLARAERMVDQLNLVRRARSPDWNAKLGRAPDGWKPDETMYCTRCLRKYPKRIHRKDPTAEKQMGSHITGSGGSCNTRNGPGEVGEGTVGLPNRSGWITAANLNAAGLKLTKLKTAFEEKYPKYTATVYPSVDKRATTSVWSKDPNNDIITKSSRAASADAEDDDDDDDGNGSGGDDGDDGGDGGDGGDDGDDGGSGDGGGSGGDGSGGGDGGDGDDGDDGGDSGDGGDGNDDGGSGDGDDSDDGDDGDYGDDGDDDDDDEDDGDDGGDDSDGDYNGGNSLEGWLHNLPPEDRQFRGTASSQSSNRSTTNTRGTTSSQAPNQAGTNTRGTTSTQSSTSHTTNPQATTPLRNSNPSTVSANIAALSQPRSQHYEPWGTPSSPSSTSRTTNPRATTPPRNSNPSTVSANIAALSQSLGLNTTNPGGTIPSQGSGLNTTSPRATAPPRNSNPSTVSANIAALSQSLGLNTTNPGGAPSSPSSTSRTTNPKAAIPPRNSDPSTVSANVAALSRSLGLTGANAQRTTPSQGSAPNAPAQEGAAQDPAWRDPGAVYSEDEEPASPEVSRDALDLQTDLTEAMAAVESGSPARSTRPAEPGARGPKRTRL
ncbi:unnamed protein product [Parascedosporium putredinis]|uniref:Uncharacterized protein n=1 Tax=Parascedosporium putredinis TaxID=1442378 RepID=A0A9P1H0U1_9PEZI|nr:unnamed protein product [Parascedosporium putredinis]CAI7994278.1 unnamed protein product [Parascedosporium putredinis]